MMSWLQFRLLTEFGRSKQNLVKFCPQQCLQFLKKNPSILLMIAHPWNQCFCFLPVNAPLQQRTLIFQNGMGSRLDLSSSNPNPLSNIIFALVLLCHKERNFLGICPLHRRLSKWLFLDKECFKTVHFWSPRSTYTNILWQIIPTDQKPAGCCSNKAQLSHSGVFLMANVFRPCASQKPG